MWSNHHSVLQDHLQYICNNIVKSFHVDILRYAERVQEIHDIAKYLPPPSMKGESFEEASWKFHKKEWSDHDIRVAIEEGFPSSMHDELEDNQEDYSSLTH